MEQVLNQILSKLTSLEEGQNQIKSDVASLKAEVTEIKADVKEINRKASVIFDQTAGLTEFQTEAKEFQGKTTSDLKAIIREVSFVCHREVETEKDVLDIKKHLEIVR